MKDSSFEKRVKARIARIQRTAHQVTEALGLPPEAVYEVMSVIYEPKPAVTGTEAD